MRRAPSVLSALVVAVAAVAQDKRGPAERDGSPGDACRSCHATATPVIVADWETSRHSAAGVACDACHGAEHRSRDDVARARPATPETCKRCHAARVEQFGRSKHALAWSAMQAMPTLHRQPMAFVEGQKGCGGCHKIGLKDEKALRALEASGAGYGNASCDACHTRHTFSVAEARSPQACRTCHTGFDHAQWEMYSGSKHGVRAELRQLGVVPRDGTLTPTCQACHMQGGDHAVRTAWGFMAVKLPKPADPRWAADQETILKALGALTPGGDPTKRLEALGAAQVARFTAEGWERERERAVAACAQCHAGAFAKAELAKGDDLVREADRLMAEGIRVVAALYREGLLRRRKGQQHAFPDLLAFHDAGSVVEQKLFVMFFEHRMRTFQGAFHANPDYAFWYGWSGLVRDLAEIKEAAATMRARARSEAPKATAPAPATTSGK